VSDSSAVGRASGILGGSSSASARRRRENAQVSTYDFRRPINLSREKTRLLQICFETFARQASTVLTSALRSVSTVELLGVEQVSYAEYVETLGAISYMTVFSLDPMQEPAIFEMPLDVTMTCIDKLLGGPGNGEQPARPLTDLESAVVGTLYERIVGEFRHSFETVGHFEPRITGVEYDPQLAQLAGASDAMVVTRLRLHLGDSDYPLSVALSLTGMLPFLNVAESAEAVTDRDRARRQEAHERLSAGLQGIPVDVAVRFRGTAADPVELAALQVGDVVRLAHPAQSPLDVTAADVVFAHATPGSQGSRLAALVVAPSTAEKS
jgi:flagellar motor switch protein FliM